MTLFHKSGNKAGCEVRVGDKIPGGRADKFYATVEKIGADSLVVFYNGEVKSYTFGFEEAERLGLRLEECIEDQINREHFEGWRERMEGN
jgi:hypothetical protein